ncbi:LOW QUALITY PROTEIN: Gag-Pol polyprotein [Plecturocebus cupreus]
MEKQKLDFLIDTSASYLVVNTPATELSHTSVNIVGVSRKPRSEQFLCPLSCKTAQFLYLAEICYASYKIKSSSTLRNVRFVSKCLQNTDCSCEHFWQALRFSALRDFPQEVFDKIKPEVWASDQPGRAINMSPVKIKLKEGTQFWFLLYDLIRPCQSYNTPVLLVKETHSHEYRFMQDLRAINDIVEDIHPTVANPYTTFASLPGNHE